MRIDVSLASFALVLALAAPVVALRSETYSVGYEIGELKQTERELLKEQMKLRVELEKERTKVYEQARASLLYPADQDVLGFDTENAHPLSTRDSAREFTE